MRSPEPPLLQTEQSQFPQSLLIRLMLQNPHSYIALFWTRSGPQCLFCSEKPKTEHNIRVEYRGTITSLFLLATLFLVQARMPLALLATWAQLAHVQLSSNQPPLVPFLFTVIQPLSPKPIALHGVIVAKVQDLALGLAEPHPIHLSPAIQLLLIPLKGLPALRQINTTSLLGVICKFTEGTLNPLI